LVKDLLGKLFADKGYVSQALFEHLLVLLCHRIKLMAWASRNDRRMRQKNHWTS
jgi:hypothetical protein